MRKKKSTRTIRISEAATILGINPMTLRRWDQSGHLKAIRIGPRKDRRYKKEDILKLLKKQK